LPAMAPCSGPMRAAPALRALVLLTMLMATLRLIVPPQRSSYWPTMGAAFCAPPSQRLSRLPPRRAAAKTAPSGGVEDAKAPDPAEAAADKKAVNGAAPSPAPKSAEATTTTATETDSKNQRGVASVATDLAQEEQRVAKASEMDSPQQGQAAKQEPPGILNQFQASLQEQAGKALDSTVGAAQRKVIALPAEIQKSIAESVQRQVDSATGRLKSLPQDALDGVVGFARDRVGDASSSVQTGVQGALSATVAAPGEFVVQMGSEAQRTAAKAAQVTGGRILSVPGSLAAATQQRASALASEAVGSTLSLPSEFAGTVALVPIRAQEAVTRAAKDTLDTITGNPPPPPPRPPPRRPLAQRIADFPNEVVTSVQSTAERRVRAVVTDTSKLVGEIGSTPANIGLAVTAGVSNRVWEAAQDTGRLADEIGSAPARLGFAVQAGVQGRIESASQDPGRLVDEINAAPSVASSRVQRAADDTASSVQRAADDAANLAAEKFNKAIEGPVQLGRDIAALPGRAQKRAEELRLELLGGGGLANN